jgi:low affinity Fe/Cu permease
MTTFKYWMVANFEILAAVVAGFISILLVLCFYNEEQHPNETVGDVVIVFFFLFLLTCAQGKSRYLSLIKYIIALLICIGVTLVSSDGETTTEISTTVIVFWWIFLVAGTIIGIKLAIFTNRNIDEIVSRRMLYRNSSVDLFEIKWLYTLDRFAGTASSIAMCLGLMAYLIYYYL